MRRAARRLTTAALAMAVPAALAALPAAADAATGPGVRPAVVVQARVSALQRIGAALGRGGIARRPVRPAPATALPSLGGLPVGGIFGAASVWRVDVSAAPVTASSAQLAGDVAHAVTSRYNGVAAFNAHDYATSFWTALPGTTRVDVAYDDCQHKGYEPAGLAAQLAGIPIPADAVPSAGSDSELFVWSPATDQEWELWEAHRTAGGWAACFGGRIDHVSTSSGVFGGGFGASASGLALAGGAISLADVRAGHIDHAIALDIPDTAAWPAVTAPAVRTDGGDTGSDAVPMGTRMRIDPTLDVDAIPGLSPIARMVAKAGQRYGFIVSDTSGAVSFGGESGVAEQRVTGLDPWVALERGLPDYQVFEGFPWSHLQVVAGP